MLKIRVVRPVEPGEAGPSKQTERPKTATKGKDREVGTSWDKEVLAKTEEDREMRRRRIARRIAERRVDLEMLMDEIESLEELLENEE